jgi:hypothetical protein
LELPSTETKESRRPRINPNKGKLGVAIAVHQKRAVWASFIMLIVLSDSFRTATQVEQLAHPRHRPV